MTLQTIATWMPLTVALVGYAYFTAPSKPAPQEPAPQEDWTDWNILKTDAEEAQEEQDKQLEMKEQMLQKVDGIFVSRVTKEVYSSDVLAQSESVVKFNPFGSERYSRRSALLPSIYDTSSNYLSDLSEKVIEKYLGASSRVPKDHFRMQLAKKDPTALQVAALFYQLTAPLSNFANEPENLDGLEEVLVSTLEIGRLQFYDKTGDRLVFSIVGDEVQLNSLDEKLEGYKSTRLVTIGFPSKDNSVECTIQTTYDRMREE